MLTGEEVQVARRSMLLSAAPDDAAEAILQQAVSCRFERGTTVFLQGEPAHSIFIVLTGWVKLYRISQTGSEAVVGVFTKGRSFGEAAALQTDTYPVAAEAVTDCHLLQVRASTVLQMMRSRPELGTAMLAATYKHLHALVAQIEQLKAHTGAQRVAEFLLDLCPVDEGACTVVLPYEKVLIAGRLGMKPESLSRAFARLREAGVSIRKSNATIADVGELRAYVERDPAMAWSHAL